MFSQVVLIRHLKLRRGRKEKEMQKCTLHQLKVIFCDDYTHSKDNRTLEKKKNKRCHANFLGILLEDKNQRRWCFNNHEDRKIVHVDQDSSTTCQDSFLEELI